MKINVKIKNDFTSRVPVWFGKIKDGAVWKNNKIDLKQTQRRTALKKYLKEQEDLELHLNKWAREAGF